MIDSLNHPCTRSDFGDLVGLTRQRVDQLAAAGLLESGATARAWLQAYIERLRDIAAGRDPDGVLVNERAQLTRSQRINQDMRNAILQGEFAPIGLLADILGIASAALAQGLEALPGRLKMICPELPDATRAAIESNIAAARNEWMRSTAELVEAKLAALSGVDDQEDRDAAAPEGRS